MPEQLNNHLESMKGISLQILKFLVCVLCLCLSELLFIYLKMSLESLWQVFDEVDQLLDLNY
jgi:hypothetical protein